MLDGEEFLLELRNLTMDLHTDSWIPLLASHARTDTDNMHTHTHTHLLFSFFCLSQLAIVLLFLLGIFNAVVGSVFDVSNRTFGHF